MNTDQRDIELLIDTMSDWGDAPSFYCACGRVSFVESGQGMDERYYLELKDRAVTDVTVIARKGSSIVFHTRLRRVVGCPCCFFDSLTGFLLENRDDVIEFYERYADRSFMESRQQLRNLKDAMISAATRNKERPPSD